MVPYKVSMCVCMEPPPVPKALLEEQMWGVWGGWGEALLCVSHTPLGGVWGVGGVWGFPEMEPPPPFFPVWQLRVWGGGLGLGRALRPALRPLGC